MDSTESCIILDDFSSSDLTMSTASAEEIIPLVLLADSVDIVMAGTVKTLNVYERFTETKKKLIFAVIMWTSVMPAFISGAFAAGFLNIGKDLEIDSTVLNYVLGSYVFVRAVGSLFWGVYAGFYGRRFVFIASLPFLCLGCLGVALSRTLTELFVSRILQAIGVASITSTSVAIISDIYPPEFRGTAIGIWTGNPIPALAPLLSGIVTSYYSWRAMHVILLLMSSLGLFLSVTILPETSHPGSRGVEKMFPREFLSRPNAGHGGGLNIKFSQLVWLNPFQSLILLRIPVISLWALSLTSAWVTGTAMWDALPVNFSLRYGIESPIAIGLCYLPVDISYILGSALAGYLSDKALTKARRRRTVPEDRLHEAFFGLLFLVPPSVLLAGLTMEYVTGVLGLVLNFIFLFANGFGIGVVHSPAFAYMLDIQREKSAETKAINSALENVFSSFFSATILPSINAFGVGWTFTGIAVVGWIGAFLFHLIIRHGALLREGL